MSAPHRLDAERLLHALNTAGVRYVVIGGYSLAAHGVVRGTKDVDIVPAPDSSNLDRLADALASLGAEVLLAEDFDQAELGLEPDVEGLALGGNWCLATSLGRLDVMQDVPGAPSYETLEVNAVAIDIGGVDQQVRFAGYDDLVRMKAASGREQDMLDIASLERARGAS